MSKNPIKLFNDCCPEFDTERWNDKVFIWNKKKFITESIPTINHIPQEADIEKAITEMMTAAQNAKALSEDILESLVLFMDPSPSQSNIYLSVEKDVPEAKNITLSGKYVAKVYDGTYEKIPQFIEDLTGFLKERDIESNNMYVHHAYCPICAVTAGHNYAVLFAEVDRNANTEQLFDTQSTLINV